MDVDNDIDGKLLQQFDALGTTDREVLVEEFRKLLGNTVNPDSCAFFLDMNNWNLQAAICSYYDIEQPVVDLPSMTVMDDVTVGQGESVPPNTKFFKTWRIKNTGLERWPPGCSLRCVEGNNMGHDSWLIVDALGPGQCYDINLQLTSPSVNGTYQSQWRMATPTGRFFGDSVWAFVTVEENGLLELTQQMSRFGNFATPQQRLYEEQCRLGQNQMALVPVSTESEMASTIVHNNFSSQESQPPVSSPSSRWLIQSSNEISVPDDPCQDTEMS